MSIRINVIDTIDAAVDLTFDAAGNAAKGSSFYSLLSWLVISCRNAAKLLLLRRYYSRVVVPLLAIVFYRFQYRLPFIAYRLSFIAYAPLTLLSYAYSLPLAHFQPCQAIL